MQPLDLEGSHVVVLVMTALTLRFFYVSSVLPRILPGGDTKLL